MLTCCPQSPSCAACPCQGKAGIVEGPQLTPAPLRSMAEKRAHKIIDCFSSSHENQAGQTARPLASL